MGKMIPATLEDVAWLSSRLREADVRECEAMINDEPLAGLLVSFSNSTESFAIKGDNGETVGICGVVETAPRRGAIWMVGTEELTGNFSHILQLVRKGRVWIESLGDRFDVLYNFVDVRNEAHIEWLIRMGFTFGPELYINGYQFRGFFKCV